MTGEFGPLLKVLREQAGLSLHALAHRVNWSKAAIGHAETGTRAPSPELARALDGQLRANGLLIAVAAADRAHSRTVNRRDLLKVVAAGTAPLAALAPQGSPTVAGLVARTAWLRRLDDSLGGADTHALFLAETVRTAELLRRGGLDDGTRRALLRLLAEQYQLAGWAAFDGGRRDRSIPLYRRSRRAAQEAGDTDLFANALALEAYEKAFMGDPDPVLARASCEAIRADAPAAVRALTLDRAAWTYAVAGLADDSEHALDRTARALDGSAGPPPPDWAAWVDPREVAIMTGRCWAVLGRPLRAAPPLERALADFPEEHARDKSLYLLALSEAYLHGHEAEAAARTIRRAHALTAGVASARPALRLRRLLALASRVDAPPLRDLAELAVSPRPAPGAPSRRTPPPRPSPTPP